MKKEKAWAYIRWSSDKQKEGDSKRRQYKLAKEYAEKENLELIVLTDEGKSAFKSEHIKEGKLGQFFKDVDAGIIPKGSKLIVENLDRLSREELFTDRVKEILDKGIQLYVSSTKRFWTKEDWSIANEIESAVTRYHAHKYSDDLRDRASAAWEGKRIKAKKQGKPLNRICTQWMFAVDDENGNHIGFKLKDGKNKYKNGETTPDVVTPVQMMFEMKASGMGAARIRNELNKRDDLYKPKVGWTKATINRYLQGKQVLGHLEFKKRDGKKRVPTGEIAYGYYPQIIDEDLWYKAKAVFDANAKKNGNAGGRTGAENNLFRHIEINCKACGDGKMEFKNHGDHSYLRCKNNIRHNGCTKSRSIRYSDVFEPLILRYCNRLDVTDILPNDTKRQTELSRLGGDLQSVKGKYEELQQAIENRNKVLNIEDDEQMIEFHSEKLKELVGQQTAKKKEMEKLQSQIDKLSQSKKQTAERLKNVQQLIEYLDKVEGDERINLRIKLRNKLQQLIEYINIGFTKIFEDGLPYTLFVISFKDGVQRNLGMIDGELDEVVTDENGEVDVQHIHNIYSERGSETSRLDEMW
jgi:DNA invertase Pin-like site-specific DNA recombinase